MDQKDRIQLIPTEQCIRQKDFAHAIKVTESYESNMLRGKRSNISESLALLIEQVYGYSAQWVLTGEGEPRVSTSAPILSPIQKRLIQKIETMSEPELNAVQVFIDSLDDYKRAFGLPDETRN